MTERFHVESSSGTSSVDAASESADASQASPGATGSKASTSHTANLSQLIALAPPSSSCGSDTVEPAGTGCTDDDYPCTTDVCNGSVSAPACTHPNKANGTTCDDGLFCNGADSCSAGVCTHSGDPCAGGPECDNSCNEAADNCHTAAANGTACRAAAGPCDVAATCTGTSGACPVDGFASASTSCTGASQGGVCDNDAADHCTGTGNACVDVFQTASYTCRASAGQCDVAETCTGTSGVCPADGFASSSTSCTGASDRKSTRLNSSHSQISYAVFCLKKKKKQKKSMLLRFAYML